MLSFNLRHVCYKHVSYICSHYGHVLGFKVGKNNNKSNKKYVQLQCMITRNVEFYADFKTVENCNIYYLKKL
jgi:hypothetical protein